MAGDWLIAQHKDLERAVEGKLYYTEPLFAEMEARHLIAADPNHSTLAPLLSQYRTRKSYLEHGPSLCSGQLIPDTGLSFSSATAGARPPLN